MQRILVIGCPGGGKSTLARALGAKLALPVTHLDSIWWQPGWVEMGAEKFRPLVEAVAAKDRWVIDGNYSNTFDIRMPRADTIVWVDQPRLTCLWRVFARAVTQLDPEFFRYVWSFRREHEAKIEAALAEHGAPARVFRLRSDSEVAEFMLAI